MIFCYNSFWTVTRNSRINCNYKKGCYTILLKYSLTFHNENKTDANKSTCCMNVRFLIILLVMLWLCSLQKFYIEFLIWWSINSKLFHLSWWLIFCMKIIPQKHPDYMKYLNFFLTFPWFFTKIFKFPIFQVYPSQTLNTIFTSGLVMFAYCFLFDFIEYFY